jgi:hypothetical protein
MLRRRGWRQEGSHRVHALPVLFGLFNAKANEGGRGRAEAQRDAVVRTACRGHAVMAVVGQIEISG